MVASILAILEGLVGLVYIFNGKVAGLAISCAPVYRLTFRKAYQRNAYRCQDRKPAAFYVGHARIDEGNQPVCLGIACEARKGPHPQYIVTDTVIGNNRGTIKFHKQSVCDGGDAIFIFFCQQIEAFEIGLGDTDLGFLEFGRAHSHAPSLLGANAQAFFPLRWDIFFVSENCR